MDVRLGDGTIVKNVPEGTSQEDLMSRLAEAGHRPKQSAGSSVFDHLDAIDKQRPTSTEPEANFQGANYIGQQLKKGVAAGLGLPVDAATNVMNLGIAGYGMGKNLLTGSSDLPALIDPRTTFGGAASIERGLLTNNNVQPTGPINAMAGRFVRDIGTAAVPIAGIAGRPAAFLPRNASPVQMLQAQAQSPVAPLAAGGALTGMASAGGETGRTLAPEPYKDIADLSGQLIGGIALPAAVVSRIEAVNDLRKAAQQDNVNRHATDFVEGKIQGDVRAYPGARDRLNEALQLEDEIPGFQARVGQASGVPSLIDMERRVATAGPEQFNKRSIQDSVQREAIAKYADEKLPLLAGKSDVGTRLENTRTQRNELADALPSVAAEETGHSLRTIRGNLKRRFDQVAAEKFDAPVQEAERLRVSINPDQLITKSADLFRDPVVQYDATNAPAIARRILEVTQRQEATYDGPKLLNSKGEALITPRDRPTQISFADLKGMREAVGQDIARERGNPSPTARQRLRALYEIQNEIDRTAQQAPESVRGLWNSARDWYRDEYSPRFLRGTNLKQSLKDISGEPRIADEKLAGQYFKKLGSTPMNRFLKLYVDSPQAMKAMDDHILDTYRREVVKDGLIDPKKHDVFIRNYEPALKQVPEMRQNLDSMGNAARLLSERESMLSRTQSLLDRGQLDRLRYEDHGTLGLDPSKLDSFLKKSGRDFKESVSSIYGEKVATEHLENLEKIAKAATIAERGKLSENAFPAQSTNPLGLQGALGFSGRTVFSMLRAVTTGRTSTEDMAFTLGMQSASHRISKALIAAEEKAISDPQTARLIAEAMKVSPATEAGQTTLRKILEKGGLYVVNASTGGKNYGRMTKYQAAPFAVDANGVVIEPASDTKQTTRSTNPVDGRFIAREPYTGGPRTPSVGVRG